MNVLYPNDVIEEVVIGYLKNFLKQPHLGYIFKVNTQLWVAKESSLCHSSST